MSTIEWLFYMLDERNRLSHIAAYALASTAATLIFHAAVYQPAYWKWEVVAIAVCVVGPVGFTKIGDHFESRDVEADKRKRRNWRL